MLKVVNVRVPVGEDETGLAATCSVRLRLSPDAIESFRILRKSLDIRDKRRLEHVYTLAIGCRNEAEVASRTHTGPIRVMPFEPEEFREPTPGTIPLDDRPVVVGAGPGGLMAAYFLAERGYMPLVLERGQPVSRRIRDVNSFDEGAPLDPESNYLFGEGGAGTFSDGKLTCRSTGPDTERVLRIIAENKGKPSIVYEAKPHLGSNRLPAVVKAMRQRIEELGGEVRFHCRLDDIECTDGRLTGLQTNQGLIRASAVVLATGHSARDTYVMLHHRGVRMVARPFQMGVRIEQPQANVTRVQYGTGPATRFLGPADYSLNVRAGDHDLFTFCMCAGGYIMPSVSQHGYFCTNGMSRSRHESPFANSGLVMSIDPGLLLSPGVDPADDPLVGIRFQEQIEATAYRLGGGDYDAPLQWARDFIAQRQSTGRVTTSYRRGSRNVNLWELLPAHVSRTLALGLPLMDRSWRGMFLRDAVLTGPEARGSCPVRIERDSQSRQSVTMAGLYPVGEGAGFAGGIVSAAVDGLRTARAIIEQYAPIRR